MSAMKLVNGGGGGGGSGVGAGGGAGVGGGAEKTTFSFKKCSAFQFVKRKVSLEDSCLRDARGRSALPLCFGAFACQR